MTEILIGFISGIITSFGMGGGTILILLLGLILGVSQTAAQSVNLIYFIPTSLMAILVNVKQKNIEYKTGIVIIIFGVIGAVIGATIAMNIETNLRRYFAVFLLFIALYETYSIFKMLKK